MSASRKSSKQAVRGIYVHSFLSILITTHPSCWKTNKTREALNQSIKIFQIKKPPHSPTSQSNPLQAPLLVHLLGLPAARAALAVVEGVQARDGEGRGLRREGRHVVGRVRQQLVHLLRAVHDERPARGLPEATRLGSGWEWCWDGVRWGGVDGHCG